jgi:hypothetical protein
MHKCAFAGNANLFNCNVIGNTLWHYQMTDPSLRKPVRKAVFPVAGLGTRFLPATKAIPKEMLPIIDRPLIQYAID